jgi:hypothetical protein
VVDELLCQKLIDSFKPASDLRLVDEPADQRFVLCE